MPVYSFGTDSPLKIEISDEDATAYNRVTKSFFAAQQKYRDEHNGTPWDQRSPLAFDNIEEGDMATYNRVGSIINSAVKSFGRAIQMEELTDDFLVKN
jgi:hypothetical protein